MAARKKPTPRGSQSGQKPGKAKPVTITSGRNTGSSGPDLAAIARGMGSGGSSSGRTGSPRSGVKPKPAPAGQARRKKPKPKKYPAGTIIVA